MKVDACLDQLAVSLPPRSLHVIGWVTSTFHRNGLRGRQGPSSWQDFSQNKEVQALFIGKPEGLGCLRGHSGRVPRKRRGTGRGRVCGVVTESGPVVQG